MRVCARVCERRCVGLFCLIVLFVQHEFARVCVVCVCVCVFVGTLTSVVVIVQQILLFGWY